MNIKRKANNALRKFFGQVGLTSALGLPVSAKSVEDYLSDCFSTYSPNKLTICAAEWREESWPEGGYDVLPWKFRILRKRLVKEAYVLYLSQAVVEGRNGGVITKEGILLRDVSREFGNSRRHSLLERTRAIRPKKAQGRVAVLHTAGANTYYHWIVDILPRIYLLEQAGVLESVDKFLLPPLKHAFQYESLQALGINLAKIQIVDKDEQVLAAELFVPSLPSLLGTVNPWAINFLNKRLFQGTLREGKGKKIYISRKGNVQRGYMNEGDIRDIMSQKGFAILYAEEYSLEEQVAIFRNAEIVVAPHGSGLTNIIFCPEGGIVVDLLPMDFIVPCFWTIANARKLRYFPVFAGESNESTFKPYWENPVRETVFPIDKLLHILDRILT